MAASDKAVDGLLSMLQEVINKPNPHPEGKLTEDDNGACFMAVSCVDGKVMLRFPQAVKWIAFPPEQAKMIAELLLKHAADAETKKDDHA